MSFRTLLVGLIYAFFTLLAALAVTIGGYALATAVEDSLLALVLRIIGFGCLLLLVVNAVLLLLTLAMHALSIEERLDRLQGGHEPASEGARSGDEAGA